MDLIAGSLAEPRSPDGVIEDTSPADLEVRLGLHGWALAQVDRAVQAARAALPAFAARPPQERVQLVRRIGAVL
ncbi:MAG TPA: aldehyde dehydrogenase family protein, partial [Myxococcales bacterium]|nr:aldehyde dehydrogenase family protein [Myxococcales bacterium]